MANPNIVQTTSIEGVTTQSIPDVAGPGGNYLVPRLAPVASDKVYKVNTLFVTNINTTTDYECTVYHYIANNSGSGSSSARLAANVVVPAKSNIVIVSGDNPVYLREGDYIAGFSNVVSTLTYTISYEIIS